jgi:two-component system OmpR family sensor kinase
VKGFLDSWRRLRLATRLALGIGVLALVVFAIVGAVLVTTMHNYLQQRMDEQLTMIQVDQTRRLQQPYEHGGTPRPQTGQLKAPDGGFTAVFQVDGGAAKPKTYDDNLPADRGALADVALAVPLGDAARSIPNPEVYRTVYVHDQGSYRVRACPVQANEVLVSAAPMKDLDDTTRQLMLVLGAAFILALAVLVFVGRLVLRRGLRPLSDMAATAQHITSHDLTRSADLPVRVSGRGGGVEVDELRTAFNRMLEHIDASLAARAAADERLRRFVADASHELRTPLTSIRGYADLFSYAAANEPVERDAHLAKIREETARMSVLVDDLLLLARLDSADAEAPVRLSPTDLAAIARSAAEAFRVAHPDHPLESHIGGGPVWLDADPVRLRQVLDNLLANVAAHTPPGTPATIRLDTSPGWAAVSIVDEGPGIPSAHQSRIFDRFYRVDNSRSRRSGGAGLGLAVVQLLVAAHGGMVELHSAPGRTEFVVRLPVPSEAM